MALLAPYGPIGLSEPFGPALDEEEEYYPGVVIEFRTFDPNRDIMVVSNGHLLLVDSTC